MLDKWYGILMEITLLKMKGVDIPLSLDVKLEEFTKTMEKHNA